MKKNISILFLLFFLLLSSPALGDDIRFWVDENGVKNFANDSLQTSQVTRNEKSLKANSVTKIRIEKGLVYVPIRITYQGRDLIVELILDSGSTTSSINNIHSANLNIPKTAAQPIFKKVADGRIVKSYITTVDSVMVGQYTLSNVKMEIINQATGIPGLLGMNILKHFDYRIDFKNKLIFWNRKA